MYWGNTIVQAINSYLPNGIADSYLSRPGDDILWTCHETRFFNQIDDELTWLLSYDLSPCFWEKTKSCVRRRKRKLPFVMRFFHMQEITWTFGWIREGKDRIQIQNIIPTWTLTIYYSTYTAPGVNPTKNFSLLMQNFSVFAF